MEIRLRGCAQLLREHAKSREGTRCSSAAECRRRKAESGNRTRSLLGVGLGLGAGAGADAAAPKLPLKARCAPPPPTAPKSPRQSHRQAKEAPHPPVPRVLLPSLAVAVERFGEILPSRAWRNMRRSPKNQESKRCCRPGPAREEFIQCARHTSFLSLSRFCLSTAHTCAQQHART